MSDCERERANSPPLLRIEGLSKHFANVHALTDVGFALHGGEILALMGENGAGKSTLLKILSGDYKADAGIVAIDGQPVIFSSPRDARGAGIRVISQEPEIVPAVSVAENLFLGDLPRRGPGIVDRRHLMTHARELLLHFGFADTLDPAALGENLSPAQRQLVEIVRALAAEARVLALDEPTSSLTEEEADRLFALVDRLRARGIAIIYVTHRMREIARLADRVVILRDGRLVADAPMADLSQGDIVRLMVGRPLQDVLQRTRIIRDEVMLDVRGLRTVTHTGITFTVRAGEIVALAGLVGAGRSELVRAIFGDFERLGGRVIVDGRDVPANDTHAAIAAGIALAPEDRKRMALLLLRSVLENVTLPILGKLSTAGFVRTRPQRAVGKAFVDRLRIRTPSLEQDVAKLSGGNQQKVVIARWMATTPKLLILDEPTRGIDVGAKAEIYTLIDELAASGMAVLLVSSELPEILGLADRILVMQNGRITGELDAAQATERAIMELAMIDHLEPTVAGVTR